MQVTSRLSVGSVTGFIGVQVSPTRSWRRWPRPLGTVEVINLATLHVQWTHVYDQPSGATAFPCDIGGPHSRPWSSR